MHRIQTLFFLVHKLYNKQWCIDCMSEHDDNSLSSDSLAMVLFFSRFRVAVEHVKHTLKIPYKTIPVKCSSSIVLRASPLSWWHKTSLEDVGSNTNKKQLQASNKILFSIEKYRELQYSCALCHMHIIKHVKLQHTNEQCLKIAHLKKTQGHLIFRLTPHRKGGILRGLRVCGFSCSVKH